MNDQTNHIKMKAVTMLIVKSESIQKYMLLRRSNEWIEENEWKDDLVSKRLLKIHSTMKNDLLKLTTEKQIYSNACDEYAEITSLLFN